MLKEARVAFWLGRQLGTCFNAVTAWRWRDEMDWLRDDEMKMQWKEVSKDEEEITVKRRETGSYKSRRYTVHRNRVLPKHK